MTELRPVFHVIGLILVVLGGFMLVPALVDYATSSGNAGAFMLSAALTVTFGTIFALANLGGGNGARAAEFNLRQAYVLTVGVWVVVPGFGALPFMIGAPSLSWTNAYFEAVSGITTTGSSVIVGLDKLPAGMNLWRGMLNALGGLGIAIVAMIFLPIMRVGGMQFFKVQGYDTFGKALPRAADIAMAVLGVYVALIVMAGLTYSALGMSWLDATVMGMASIATGGFAPTDISFTKYPGAPEYAGVLFMYLASMPYVLYAQMASGGEVMRFLRDPQVRAFSLWIVIAVAIVVTWRILVAGGDFEPTFRDALFNIVSVMTGTGFFTGSFTSWGGFALVMAFVVGMVGGCTGSSSGALSVFRVRLILAALNAEIKRVASPSRVVPIHYDGRQVEPETLDGLMMFAFAYIFAIGVLSVTLSLTGVDMTSALFAVWTSIGNIGYGIGPALAPTGTFVDFPLASKWVLIVTMLLGRTALLAAFVIMMPRFWRV